MAKIFVIVLSVLLYCPISSHAETIGDIDGDNLVGLEESIYALQVASGLQPTQVEQVTLKVKPAFSSSLSGLGTLIDWMKNRIGVLSKDRVLIEIDTTSVSSSEFITQVSDGTLQAVHGYSGYHAIPAAFLSGLK